MDFTEIDARFCRNVRHLRQKYQVSQPTLAGLLGIGCRSLQRLESGEIPARFNCRTLCRVCDIFNISADALIYDDLTVPDNAKP